MGRDRDKGIWAVGRILFAVVVCVISSGSLSLGQTETGEVASDWREGLSWVRDCPRMVHSAQAAGSEDLYFKGDTAAFNEFLEKLGDLKLPEYRITVKQDYGKISNKHFDWVLHIPNETLGNGERQGAANQAYPAVTVYATVGGIRLGEVILPQGADVSVARSEQKDYWGIAEGVETAKKWAAARRKWREFIGSYLSRVRQKEDNPSIQWVEMRSALVEKYLPRHRIYLVETTRLSVSSIFAMSVGSEITDLGNGAWSSPDEEECFRNQRVSDFFQAQKMTIADVNTAMDVARLTEEIRSAPGAATMLRQNTSNFTIFDRRLYDVWRKDENWRYEAKREEGYWLATRKYVGPPAMIIAPPRWEIVVDKDDRFVEIRHR